MASCIRVEGDKYNIRVVVVLLQQIEEISLCNCRTSVLSNDLPRLYTHDNNNNSMDIVVEALLCV